jgi:hypothetical protein
MTKIRRNCTEEFKIEAAWLEEGLYLAAVLDLCSRRIIRCQCESSGDTSP